jgi:acetoin utilization protein AcuB
MFVGMWMTRELITVDPAATLAHIAVTMARRKIRRLPVVNATPDGPQLLGIITHSDVLHAFPVNINPFAAMAADSIATLESSGRQARVYAADLMARDPLVTTPDAPIESAARLMRDRKISALPVVTGGILVGLITESDIFRAMVEIFEARGRAVRITFSLKPGEDILPLVAEIAQRRSLRVTNFITLSHHEPPLCVVQLAGAKLEEALDDVWKSQHRVMNVVQLTPDETGRLTT